MDFLCECMCVCICFPFGTKLGDEKRVRNFTWLLSKKPKDREREQERRREGKSEKQLTFYL